jgi:1,4-dihydroxy-2-naphthoate octaprenyltransferase
MTAPRDVSLVRAGLALTVALALQVAVNYANDLFDGLAGVDTDERRGPRRLVAAGVVAPGAMRRALVVALAVAGLAGLALALLVDLRLVAVGALAIVAALGYSGGRRPYASRGLGEVSVFVFFGLVATVGSAYVQDARLSALPIVAAVPVGLIAVALLVVNNLRDLPTDAAVGKRTLAVRLGETGTRVLYVALIGTVPLWLVALTAFTGDAWPLVGLVSLIVAAPAIATVVRVRIEDDDAPGALIRALEATGRAQLVLAVALAAGLAGPRLAA